MYTLLNTSFYAKRYSNKFQHCFEPCQQIIWTEDLYIYRLTRKPHRTPVMKKKRLDFARRHRHWTLAKWKKVLLSNECTMQQFVPQHMHIRRSLVKCFDKKYVVAAMKHPPSQMIIIF